MADDYYNHIGKTCGQCIRFKECNEVWGLLAGEKEKACPNFDEAIRVLAVRQPWASLIIEALKTIEVRSRNTTIKGPVAIYASGHKPTKSEVSSVFGLVDDLEDSGFISLHEGNEIKVVLVKSRTPEYYNMVNRVLGTVEIKKSYIVSNDEPPHRELQHLIPLHMMHKFASRSNMFFWHLENSIKFKEPVKIDKWPSGGPWVRISKSELPEFGNQ